jgi:hypothetical protein
MQPCFELTTGRGEGECGYPMSLKASAEIHPEARADPLIAGRRIPGFVADRAKAVKTF